MRKRIHEKLVHVVMLPRPYTSHFHCLYRVPGTPTIQTTKNGIKCQLEILVAVFHPDGGSIKTGAEEEVDL